MGDAVKLVGKGVNTGKVYEPVLTADQLATLETTPDTEPFDLGNRPLAAVCRAFQNREFDGVTTQPTRNPTWMKSGGGATTLRRSFKKTKAAQGGGKFGRIVYWRHSLVYLYGFFGPTPTVLR